MNTSQAAPNGAKCRIAKCCYKQVAPNGANLPMSFLPRINYGCPKFFEFLVIASAPTFRVL